MITIDYSSGIKVTTGDLTGIFSNEQLPLIIEVQKAISKEVVWTVELNSNMWAAFPESEIYDVIVKDKKGQFITRYNWEVMNHGTIFYKSLWLYCKSLINKGIQPSGLVIGTHDGEFGEWVPLARNFMSDMLLVEGSQKQYDKLVQNFSQKSNIRFRHDIITTNGESVNFFEGGKGYTNSIVERVIRSWETEEINSSDRTSTSINYLIENELNSRIDWLHLDVEGLDAKLIMSMKEYFLPPFIIFEDFNLMSDEKTNIVNFLTVRGYNLHSEGGICMARKNH